ncbi:hypothetical protein CAG70_01940 [Photobacterium halotolerans]|uniref:hypothetical protein n=1 Tax=Photobacterium halotolerans TaxID=265726 RepID=UPI0013731830|nr:hypothetical protein [Photobacterium halotolerans]NAX45763.1 hypothetical protein [Photobacterium halotolerans]
MAAFADDGVWPRQFLVHGIESFWFKFGDVGLYHHSASILSKAMSSLSPMDANR